MKYHLRFTTRFRDQATTATAWYAEIDPNLARRFVAAVEQAEDRLAESPQTYPLDQARGFRRIVTRRFPYALWYTVLSDEVHVVALIHQRQGLAPISRALPKPGQML